MDRNLISFKPKLVRFQLIIAESGYTNFLPSLPSFIFSNSEYQLSITSKSSISHHV